MMRFHLRTLLIVLALGPPMLAGAWIIWRASQNPHPPPSLEGMRRIWTTIENQPSDSPSK